MDAETLAMLEGIGSIKDRLRAKNLRAGRCTCPSCGHKGECIATLNGSRDHLHLRCRACGWRMME